MTLVLSLSLPAFAADEDARTMNPGVEPNANSSGKVGMTKQEAASIAKGLYPDCETCQNNLVQKLLGAQTTKKEDYANLLPTGNSTAPRGDRDGAQ